MSRLRGHALIATFGFWSALASSSPVLALSTTEIVCNQVGDDAHCKAAFENSFVTQVINVMSFVLGILAVLMLVIASITYVTVGGNPETASKARRAILYAVIGIIVAISAQVIVRFIIGRVG